MLVEKCFYIEKSDLNVESVLVGMYSTKLTMDF